MHTLQLKELYENVHEIKTSSETARTIISNISAESMEGINSAIENYSDFMTKIRTATSSLKELESELTAGESDYYRIIAELLVDAQKQMSFFDVYGSIPHVILLNEKLRAIQSEIKRQVSWSFREIGQLVASENNGFDESEGNSVANENQDLSSLNRIYIVVDALGPHFRKDLLERFAQLQLIPYEKLFAAGTKLSTLENLDKRFAWFKRLLSVADHRLTAYIPSRWGLAYHLFAEFVRRTKKHLTDVMSSLEKSVVDRHQHVQSLLKGVKAAAVFEAEMKASFTVSARGQDDFDSGDANLNGAANLEYFNALVSAEQIAQAFDGFLGPYVQQEREELDKLMERIMREEDAGTLVEDDGIRKPRDPFTSAKKMFDYIKKSLNRCTGYSTGFTYVSLSKELCISIHHYAESLKFRCPSPTASKPGKPPVYVINPEKEAWLFTIINTGEYCSDALPVLEISMKKNVQALHLEEIDFSAQADAFTDMVSYTLNILCMGVVERLDGSFRKLRQTNWAAVDDVIDDSPYAKEIYGILSEVIVRARNALSPVYFQQFTMKLVNVVLDALLDSIWKLKRIAKTGAGQLLLDLNGIKEYLQAMPNKRLEPGRERCPVSKAYIQVVDEKIHNIQVILKLVCTDDDKLNETFADLWPDGKQSDLDAIIALKAKAGLLAPVGDVLMDGAKEMGRGAKTAVGASVGGAKTAVDGAKTAIGGFTSALGGLSNSLLSGNMFGDESTHSSGGSSSHGFSKHDSVRKVDATASAGSGTSSVHKKGVLTGVGAAFGFANTKK
jgi:hypothetical protein